MTVALVGAGCASPRWLTEEGRDWISRADHLVFDRLIHPDSLLLAPEGCRFHPVGKREADHSVPQEGINRLLRELGRTGETVVRLKGGDPFVFGRGGEEAEALAEAGIPWVVVPGVTAALGGAASAGLPLTRRGVASALTLATAHRRADEEGDPAFWAGLARAPGTFVLYMGVSALPEAAARLTGEGLAPETPACALVWAGWGRRRTIRGTLASLAEASREGCLPAPAVIVVGPAATEEIPSIPRPLEGLQAAVCRPLPEAYETARALEGLGADAYSVPLLGRESLVRPSGDRSRGDGPEGREEDPTSVLASADWIVLTSPRGPEDLRTALGDLRRIRGRIVVLGEGTGRACRAAGLIPDAIAESPDSEGLARTLARILTRGERVVFARNQRASSLPVEAARSAGAEVRSLPLYRMTPRELPGLEIAREHWETCGLDAAVFGSSALVEAWAERIGPLPAGTRPVAWGSECARAVEQVLGRKALRMATPDREGLIAALRGLRA